MTTVPTIQRVRDSPYQRYTVPANPRIVDSSESIFELVSPHIKIQNGKGYSNGVNDLCRIHFYQII